MRVPTLRGIIDRRMLVNFRVDARVLAALLPPPFRPKTVGGFGVAGICLIRLRAIRPKGLPAWMGLTSENAAHRFAVEWDDGGLTRQGVYIPRRDTSSRLNTFVGGRLFSGIHHRANFTVHEAEGRFELAMVSDDDATSISVAANVVSQFPASTLFGSLAEASRFFEAGSLGYSATLEPARFEGLTLHCPKWRVEPLNIESVRSNYFENPRLFPAGSTAFDCALLMRGIEHEWRSEADLCCGLPATKASSV